MVLDHAKWNGLHLADLMFPTFMWTQGVSLAISMASQRRRGVSKLESLRKILIRSIKLYALGSFLNGGAELTEWRLLGVLQYFSIAYLAVGSLEVLLPAPASGSASASALSVNGGSAATAPSDVPASRGRDAAVPTSFLGALWVDVGRYWLQWAVMAVLAATYVLVQTFLHVPGCPTGYIGPGGLADQGAYFNKGCTGGAHRLIDVAWFGAHHMYHNGAGAFVTSAATCADAGMAYDCDVYDPEGVLGWLMAAWMTWLGLQAGRVFVTYRALMAAAGSDAAARRAAQWAHIRRWLVWGLVAGAAGGGLCGFAKETGLLPINKNLWSPSFVLVIAAIDFWVLAAMFFIVDCKGWGSGAPFAYVGMNSIVVYASSEILQSYFPFTAFMANGFASHAEAMASNVIGVACFVAFTRYLYIRKYFVTL